MSETVPGLLGLPDREPLLIALVGAGGKTTTMLALAAAYRAQGRRVLVTTTTRIYVPTERDRLLLCTPEEAETHAPEPGTVTVAGTAVESNGKLCGFSEAWLDRFFVSGLYDVILTEADGSKGKPLKAPASYEPVIPLQTTDVIGVIGMDALGCPAVDAVVHRLDRFLAVTGLAAGQPIGLEALLKLIGSPEGLFRYTPATARRRLLLNKCGDDPARTAAASELISRCLQTGVGDLAKGASR